LTMKATIPEEVLDEFFRVTPVTCKKHPRRGIPCASCEENKECDQVEIKEIEFADGVMRRATSSSVLSVRIPKKGDLDELMLSQLVKGFVEDKKYMMVEPEETFDVTFYVTAERHQGGVVTAQRQKKRLIRSVLEFLSTKPIEGRLKIHDWVKKEIDKFDNRTRREYKESWEEVEEVVAPTPEVVKATVHQVSVETPVVVRGSATTEGGEASVESPTSIIRFLKEDAEKGGGKYAAKFGESTASGRPLVPHAKAEVPVVEKEYLPRKAAVIEEVPPLPTDSEKAMLNHLEELVKADLPARFIADRIEQVREELRKVGYWGRTYLDMGAVARRLFQYHEGLTLSLSEKKQVIEKMSTWKKELK